MSESHEQNGTPAEPGTKPGERGAQVGAGHAVGAAGTAGEAPVTVKSVFQRLGPAGPLAVAWAVFPPLGSIVLFTYISTIGAWLRGHEGMGIALYMAAFALLAGVALLPTYASAILGGWAFGFAEGYPAALAGFGGGAVIGYFIARGAAQDRAVKLIEEHEKWRIVKEALVGRDERGRAEDGSPTAPTTRGFWKTLGVVALVRVPPNSPFALTNLVLASVKVRFAPFVLGTLIGMAPRTAAAVYIAATLREQAAAEVAKQRPWWWIAVGIVLTFVVLGVLGLVAKRALSKMGRADRHKAVG